MTKHVRRLRTLFGRLHPAYKALIALVAPVGTIIATLLALNIIQPVGGDALASSVDRTTDAASAAITMRFSSEVPDGRAMAFEANGEFDYRAGVAQLRYDYSATPGREDLTDVEVRFRRRHAYIRLAGRRSWIHADLATAQETLEDYAEAAGLEAPPELASLTEFDFNDPSRVLDRLRGASAVEELGEESVYGVGTTKYRAVVEPRQRDDQRIRATAWIDDGELIRRLDLASDDHPAPFSMTMLFAKFGTPVDVRVPRPADVTELDEVLERLLG